MNKLSKEDYLRNKINPVIEPLMVKLLTEMPTDPVELIVSYLTSAAAEVEVKKAESVKPVITLAKLRLRGKH